MREKLRRYVDLCKLHPLFMETEIAKDKAKSAESLLDLGAGLNEDRLGQEITRVTNLNGRPQTELATTMTGKYVCPDDYEELLVATVFLLYFFLETKGNNEGKPNDLVFNPLLDPIFTQKRVSYH